MSAPRANGERQTLLDKTASIETGTSLQAKRGDQPDDHENAAYASLLDGKNIHSSGIDDDDKVDDIVNNLESDSDDDFLSAPMENLPIHVIVCILSTAFSYGCIFSTLFLITLPIECERIHNEHSDVPKSVALGSFVAIAGVTQLISPLIGRLSDIYEPPGRLLLGQRLPFLVLGSVCTVAGLLGQMFASYAGFWIRYGAFFFLHMTGLNIMYAMMLALLPDQVPKQQTGIANGILAFQLVLGSLFGFGLFHSFLSDDIQSMYGLYTCIVIVSTIATGTHAHDRDAELAAHRTARRRQLAGRVRRRRSKRQRQDSFEYKAKQSQTPRWRRVAKRAANKAKEVLVLTPSMVLKSMLIETSQRMDWADFFESYTIDTVLYHDFFVVTVSRLFYYSGMSIQTFFLYYVHDVLHVTGNPEATVASLAILGQLAAAFTCYPVGLLSDKYLNRQRRPLVYFACSLLFGACLSLLFIHDLNQMMVAVAILGAANGIYLTMDTSLAVDTLPHDLEDSAQLLGVWGVAAFLGSALGPMIGGPLLYIFGSNGNMNDSTATGSSDDDDDMESYDWLGYAVVLSIGASYFLISATTLLFVRGSPSTALESSPPSGAIIGS